MSSALNIPEILLQIIGYLESHRASLLSVIRVSRLWFQCGIPLLWDGNASLYSLAKIPARRRRIYVPLIRGLIVFADDNKHDIFPPNRSQLRLNTLRLHKYHHEINGLQHLRSFMQPALRKLILSCCLLDSHLAKRLAKACPQLRKIELISCDIKVPWTLYKFLKSLHSLQEVELDTYTVESDTDNTLLHLPHIESLKTLTFGGIVTEHSPLLQIPTLTTTPFPSIQSLSIHSISFEAVARLVEMLQGFNGSLELCIQDVDDNTQITQIFSELSRLTDLRALSLTLWSLRDVYLSKDDLMALTVLTHLEKLQILCFGRFLAVSILTTTGFNDMDFECFISYFPRLRHFIVGIKWDLSAASLDSLARYCPQIISIRSSFSLKLHQCLVTFPKDAESVPKFPHLIELDIQSPMPCPFKQML